MDNAAPAGEPPRDDGAQTGPLPKRVRATRERKRAPRRKTSGRNFEPGTNSHTGEPFARGKDLIPRGTFGMIYKAVLEDDGTLARSLAQEAKRRDSPALAYRVQLARALLRSVSSRSTPRTAIAVAESMASRLEGLPTKRVETTRRRTVIFYDASKPPPPQLAGASSTPPGPFDATVAPEPEPAAPPAAPKRLPDAIESIARAGTEEPE